VFLRFNGLGSEGQLIFLFISLTTEVAPGGSTIVRVSLFVRLVRADLASILSPDPKTAEWRLLRAFKGTSKDCGAGDLLPMVNECGRFSITKEPLRGSAIEVTGVLKW
jgi:hypothetical protein